MFPLILDLLRKCQKRHENASSRCENAVTNHKQQCCLFKVLCDLKQTKKKVMAHGDCQEFSFLYRRTLKQMKQQKKRSSDNGVHLFLQLSLLLHQVSKKQHRMKKKWLAPDTTAVFSISAKKCEKCEFFSGIFALKFCEFRRFCFPPKTVDSRDSRRLTLVCRRNRGEKLQNLYKGSFFFFFFGDQHKIGEKDASIGVMTFFFEITFKPDKNDEKIFGIFTLSL